MFFIKNVKKACFTEFIVVLIYIYYNSIKKMPGKNSVVVPPESIPNSEVKRYNANGSTGSPRVRVGISQANTKKPENFRVFLYLKQNHIKYLFK